MGLIVAPTDMSFTIYQGATCRQSFIWNSGPTSTEVAPVDLTGCIARAYIREKYNSVSPLLSMTTENGRIALGGAAGTIDITLSADATASLPSLRRDARWDLEIEWPDGDVCRLLQGAVTISPEVTYD